MEERARLGALRPLPQSMSNKNKTNLKKFKQDKCEINLKSMSVRA
jgi:hypothetical protein